MVDINAKALCVVPSNNRVESIANNKIFAVLTFKIPPLFLINLRLIINLLNKQKKGKVGVGTICSVTANAILLKAGIPVTSKYGGILQIEDNKPTRFTSLISYDGTSLDPHEIFIKSKMTDVAGATHKGFGGILASFREIPAVCVDKVRETEEKMRANGLGGILLIGNPNQPLLEIPVGLDKVGIIIVGGLNPIAALEEAGIPTQSKATSMLCDIGRLAGCQAYSIGTDSATLRSSL